MKRINIFFYSEGEGEGEGRQYHIVPKETRGGRGQERQCHIVGTRGRERQSHIVPRETKGGKYVITRGREGRRRDRER